MPLLPAQNERRLIHDLLQAAGVANQDAEVVADVAVEADLRGHDSHGLARLEIQLGLLRRGAVEATARPRVEQDRGAALLVDGARSLGPVCLTFALREALDRAERWGSCTVATHAHGYTAYNGRYVELGLDRNCVTLLLGRAFGQVHAYGSAQPIMGTNPLTAAVPTAGEPLLVDMSTSAAANGKLQAAFRTGMPIPLGWAVDEQGHPTTDPAAAVRGALSPLGGAKGYALGLLIELLAGALAHGGVGTHTAGRPRGADDLWSTCAVVLHIPSFMDPVTFRQTASAFLDQVRSAPPAPGFSEVLLPGQRAYRLRRERLQGGIPTSEQVWQRVVATCAAAGLDAADYLPGSSRHRRT